MRWLRFLPASTLLGLCLSAAQAQQLPPAAGGGSPPPAIALHLSVEQTKLIVDTLGAIGCQNVAQLAVCDEAKELRREIARQAREQVK